MMQAVRWDVPLIDGAVKQSEDDPTNATSTRYAALQYGPVCNMTDYSSGDGGSRSSTCAGGSASGSMAGGSMNVRAISPV